MEPGYQLDGDIEKRVVVVNGITLVATPVPAGSWVVRFMIDGGPHYDRMMIVTENEEELYLTGWTGNLPEKSLWRIACEALFKKARRIRWCRLKANGTFSHRTLCLHRD